MIAAEFSSITKTKSVRPICAISNGVTEMFSRSHEAHEDARRTRCTKDRLVDLRDLRVFVMPWSMRRRHSLTRTPRGGQRAPPFLDVRFILVFEVLERRQDGRHGGIAERAQRLAG